MDVANVYAESLLDLANVTQSAEAIRAEFDEVIGLMDRDAAFARFMESPSVDEDVRRHSLEKMFRGRLNDTLLNALLVLNERGRANIVRDVHRQYRLALEAQLNQAEIEVTSAAPLDAHVRGSLAATLKERFGRDVILVEHVDPSIIGGLIVQYGDTRLDASVSGHLERMRARLIERASREIHSGRSYFDRAGA